MYDTLRLVVLAILVAAMPAMYVPRTINLLCAPDDCTPKAIKEAIMGCWPAKGREAWNTCVGSKGGCTLMDSNRANDCLMNEVYNMTDIKVSDCAGDKITVKMVMCSATPGGVQLRPAEDVAES